VAGDDYQQPAVYHRGMLTSGVCRKPMIAMRRGRNMVLTYICREHRGRGTCANGTGVPAIELHHAVIASLRQTFTPETFTEHLAKQAADTGAREQRAAERANLLAEIPRLAAVEARLVRRIAMAEDDALVAAIKDERNATKAQREAAERRVAELEGVERDLRAEQSEVAALVETWKSWSATLAQAQGAADGSIPAEAPAQARGRSSRRSWPAPSPSPRWRRSTAGDVVLPEGYSRYEGVLAGGLLKGGVIMTARLIDADTGQDLTARELPLPAGGLPAISGGPTRRSKRGRSCRPGGTPTWPPTPPPSRSSRPGRSRGAPRRGVLPEDRA
jgi:hypothetical protein